ncbi:MAG: hypothetical protein ACK2TT_06195 [Anaerolineales bacterium]
MMIFPKREAVYQNLNTSFTNFGELLVDLKENSLTGVVQVSFWEYEGVLLLDSGNIINAVQDVSGDLITGQDAVKLVTEKAKEKDGSINVYLQTGEMVTMLASVTKSKAVYENLSTEFTSLEALISKLQAEEHTGYIEVKMNDGRQTGYIFLLTGRVIDVLLSAGGEEISGLKVLNRILEQITSVGAVFNVYRSAVEEALSDSEVIKISYNLPQLLEVWGVVIGTVESTADSLLKKGEFLNTFKDNLISNADEYPFLDPFAAKFKYKDGEVIFTGEVKKEFSRAIAKCLWDTVEDLAVNAALGDKDLFDPIRVALRDATADYQEMIQRFNINGLLPELL